jgi:hypothetical protein
LNLGDDGLRCLTEFKVEHPGDAFNQTRPSGSVWCSIMWFIVTFRSLDSGYCILLR